jgi:hypothetical protein
MRQRTSIGALLLVLVGVVLGATVFRSDIAQATGLAQSVTIDNTATNPVPVREQNLDPQGNAKVAVENTVNNPVNTFEGNLDGNRNIRVHEQGVVTVVDPETAHQPWHMFLGPDDSYTIPAGKRLVIEYANGIAQLSGSAQPDWTLSIVEATGGQGYHFLGLSLPQCTNCYVMSQQLRLYAPAGSVVRVGVVPIGSVLRLSGYLIDI